MNQTGVGGATTNVDFRGETPLLNSFNFRFRGADVDHHLTALQQQEGPATVFVFQKSY